MDISSFSWISCTFDDFPENAVLGGFDASDSSSIFVGRVNKKYPCSLVPSRRDVIVAEIGYDENNGFEALVSDINADISWVNYTTSSAFSENSVMTHNSDSSDKLYVGRYTISDSILVGTVHSSSKQLILKHGSEDMTFSSFELLTIKFPDYLRDFINYGIQSTDTDKLADKIEEVMNKTKELSLGALLDNSEEECDVCMEFTKEFSYEFCGHKTLCQICADYFREKKRV